MTELIPNEVLECILHHILVIPTATFEAWRTPATFAGSPRSTISEVLLVSKRWYELGTPSLYESAILRTKRQVRSFAFSTKKVNDRGVKRGRYLRRLRIEGGYGDRVKAILENSPDIVHLFMGFDISLDDSSAGLKRALQRINPTRLFMDSTPGPHFTAQNTMSLHAALGGALPSWTNLKRIDTSPEFMFGTPMKPPLAHLPALEHLNMTAYTATMNYDLILLDYVIPNPAVKCIQIRDGKKWLSWTCITNRYPRDKIFLGEGKNMTRWAEFPMPQDLRWPGALSLPELPDKIWTRILGYATHVHGYNYLEFDDALVDLSKRAEVNTTRTNILLVSKRFHRLGLRYLYAIPHVTSDQAAAGLVAQLESSRELAAFLRVLHVRDEVFLRPGLCLRAPLVNLVRVKARIQVLPELGQHFQSDEASPLEWAAQVLPTSIAVAPHTFSKFAHLGCLSLAGGHGERLNDASLTALPQLAVMKLQVPGPGMFALFAAMDSLPALREFGLTVAHADDALEFFRKHGKKLQTLSLYFAGDSGSGPAAVPVLDHCPNLTELRLTTPELNNFVPVPSLKKYLSSLHLCPIPPSEGLHFPIQPFGSEHVYPQEGVKHWDAFLDFLTKHRSKLPSLDELRTLSRLEWPMHELAYEHSFATSLALELHELGIALADKEGTRWTRCTPISFPKLRRAKHADARAGNLGSFGLSGIKSGATVEPA
ncbi:hypothetical protein BN946_scf184632.g12 [Trametes cinnabarina]|uniref:F-box domain-containing protein n=1 Tax=Pycnoporus cinnabarinus TaxID=5643 RepID=A0A060SJG1_PYCCI|nr:hypothetical protein BN946_scf184632.g12 [Trametes cinnabarina]